MASLIKNTLGPNLEKRSSLEAIILLILLSADQYIIERVSFSRDRTGGVHLTKFCIYILLFRNKFRLRTLGLVI